MIDSERRRRQHWIIWGPALILLIAAGIAGCKRNTAHHYDGIWWEKTPPDQRLGFIEGFVDCYTYGCSKEVALCSKRKDLEKAVSSYYQKFGGDESKLVGEVLVEISNSEKKTPVESAVKAEILDGLAWSQYSDKKRMGFVEGFLNALMPEGSRAVRFPGGPEHYSQAVTRFYNAPPDTAGETPLNKRIGDVLWSLRK